MNRRLLGWTIFVLAGTGLLAVGCLLSLQRDAFGAETPTQFQQLIGILTAFTPFLAWLGLGKTWESVRAQLRSRLESTRATFLMCMVLCGAGIALIAMASRRVEYEIRCSPADTIVSVKSRALACNSHVWLDPSDEVNARSPGYQERWGRADVLSTDAGVLLLDLNVVSPWRCQILKDGVGDDKQDWCSGRPMRATKLSIEVDRSIVAAKSTLRAVPTGALFIKLQAPGCAPTRPLCLAHDRDGGECADVPENVRSAEMVLKPGCVKLDLSGKSARRRKVEFSVVQCGVDPSVTEKQFRIEVTEEENDAEAIDCEI